MLCPKCGAENRTESNFCRYCSTPLKQPTSSTSGYIPSVPPPGTAYGDAYNPQNFQQAAPLASLPRTAGQLCCPRCGSINVIKGGIPVWAIVAAVVGFPLVCVLSLLFLLIKDPSKCLNCGFEFK